MLDAIYQWISNTTGTTAIRAGYSPNHALIKQNLKIRYELQDEMVDENYKNFPGEFDWWIKIMDEYE